ncbi:RNA-directed DNA polymerase, eukaryota [Tanacetum coccineum]|uniref:RNA-directed DNA polymerase, eukaryota n=1 Tax=Tanacetum coccineum TaxID=301880 RepID=A0ABQ4XS92_9ASTR
MGIEDWKDVTSRKHRRSKDDEVLKISKSVFVTNFPESISARDLWKSCSVYGTVVDVFIPSKKSKVGKRFAFVRFIKVFNLDRLVENLCTIWIGNFHLFANKVRFERPHKPNVSATNNSRAPSRTEKPFNSQQTNNGVGSYANIVNGTSTGMQAPVISSSPALVLDDSCLIDRDLSNHVLGKVKEFSSIPNLHTILKDEGFSDVNVSYIGGLWVLLELTSMDTKLNLMNHIGVKSWFHTLQEACDDFVSDERIVWVDIEGVPLKAWSRETFTRIWQDLGRDTRFGRKCGFFIRDEDGVPETNNGSSFLVPNHSYEDKDAAHSDDPFGLYDLLKNKKGTTNHVPSPSLSHPPGFTPVTSENRVENLTETGAPKVFNAQGDEFPQDIPDIDRVGQVMGFLYKNFSVVGCCEGLEDITGKNKKKLLLDDCPNLLTFEGLGHKNQKGVDKDVD